ncbi:MAG: VacJ family lipoprotein [Hyphomicrobium sp.]
MKHSIYITVFISILGIHLSGCSSNLSIPAPPNYLAAPTSSSDKDLDEVKDPYEVQNRTILEQNMKFNEKVIYPIAASYRNTVPEPVREAVGNFTQNLGEPAIFANLVLQLRLEAAVQTAGRFALNSTIGLAGLFDFAKTQNISPQTGDFGQTLYVWGIRDSNYLVLPLVGPTNVRDAIGNGIQFAAMWPTAEIMPAKFASAVNNVNNLGTVLHPFSTITKVNDLQELEKGSIDFYVMLRSVVEQKRKAELDEAIATSALTAAPKPIINADNHVPLTLYDVEKFYAPSKSLSTADVIIKSKNLNSGQQSGSKIIIGEITEGS